MLRCHMLFFSEPCNAGNLVFLLAISIIPVKKSGLKTILRQVKGA